MTTAVLERDTPTPAAAPGTYPVPPGRGRWRLTLHQRTYTDTLPATSVIAELALARSRKLVQAWCTPATLTFTLDGLAPAAKYVQELTTEVVAWRWDDTAGVDVPMFRGPVVASEDDIDEQSHVVTFTCTDYLASLARRIFTTVTASASPLYDQDVQASVIVQTALTAAPSAGTPAFTPGCYLPFGTATGAAGGVGSVVPVNGDGSLRTVLSGAGRSVTFQGNAVCLTMLDNLAKLAGGFDYDVAPFSALCSANAAGTTDALRIFYPSQGVVRSTPTLYFPGNVSVLTRSVTSADYANYWRSLGNNQNAAQNAAQVYGEAWTNDAITGQAGAVGLWMSGGQGNADQTTLANLQAAARGSLNVYSVLIPSYTLTLRPGFYYAGAFNMGDTLPLVIQSGRLQVASIPPQGGLRVMGITYEPGDDGTETVTVTVGRSETDLADLIGAQAADIRALARR